MIKRLIQFEDNFSITKAAAIVGTLTLLTKFVALYRERLFAATFGQDRILDTYFSAFRIPDFVTNLFVLSTLSVAFLPIYTELLTKNKEEANRVANSILNNLLVGIMVLCGVLLVLSGPLTQKLVPGFSPEYMQHTLNLTRLFLLSPILFAASTLLGGVINARKKFFIVSLAPLLYNVGIIFGVVYLYPRFGMMGLGYGVILGAVLQLIIQAVGAFRSGFYWLPTFSVGHPSIKKLARLYAPRILAFDLANVTLLLGTVIGSTFVPGAITALNQAYNLQAVPIGVFAFALATAAFPVLSEQFALKDEKEFLSTLLKTLRQVLFFMVPISILVLLFRAYIVRLILGAGEFTWEDTIMTFNILGIFSFALISQSLTTLFSRAFFARHNTKIPVAINLCSIAVNIVLSVVLGSRFQIYGLAAAFSLSSVVNAVALFLVMRVHMHRATESRPEIMEDFDTNLYRSLAQIAGISVIMGLVSYGCIYLFEPFVNTDTAVGILVQSALSGGAGVLAFLLLAARMGLPEARPVLDFLRRFRYTVGNDKH